MSAREILDISKILRDRIDEVAERLESLEKVVEKLKDENTKLRNELDKLKGGSMSEKVKRSLWRK